MVEWTESKDTKELVGLSGFAGSGKDEAASVLVEHGYERVAFADVLRDIALAIDPFIRENTEDEHDIVIFSRLSTTIAVYGWDYAKNNFHDVRRLLQRLGTEAGRDILGENIWVDTAFRNAKSNKIVVTDCRFPNEADAIKERGGIVVRIHRDGVGPRNDHASELSLVDYDFDYHLYNNGTLEEFHENVKEALL